MDDGHGARGAGWAVLLAENAVLTGLYRGVVDRGGVEGDLVPQKQAVESVDRDALKVVIVEQHGRLPLLHLQQFLDFSRVRGFQSVMGRRGDQG